MLLINPSTSNTQRLTKGNMDILERSEMALRIFLKQVSWISFVRKIPRSHEPILGGPISEMLGPIIRVGESIIFSFLARWFLVL